MFAFRQSGLASFSWGWVAAGACAILLIGGSAAHSAINVTGDLAYPVSPDVFTVDPFAVTNANRGIAADRHLRQTFKNPATITVNQIIISFDVTSQPEYGMALSIYEVDDVLASAWTPGNLLKTLTVTDTLPGSTQRLGFDLTGSDMFELPARFEGATGYGIEISTAAGAASDGNPGVLYFSNDGTPVDYYADGRYYTESGAASSSYRDVGLSLLGSTGPAPDPGDVDNDGDVDLDDLQAILDNFRKSVGSRELGDLTGDSYVNLLDFREWKTYYPGPVPALGSLLSVPEPTALSLAWVGLAAGCAVCRRRRSRAIHFGATCVKRDK